MTVLDPHQPSEVRTNLQIAAGAIVSGIAAYTYLALGTHTFGQTAFAPTSVVWSTWAIGAATLTLPLEQWIARSATVEGSPYVARVRRRAALAGVVLLAVTVGASAVLREPFFGGGGWAYPMVMGGTWVGALAMGVARGNLSGSGRFGAAAALHAGENVARLVVGIAVLAGGLSATVYSAAIPLGSLTALVALRRRSRGGVAGARRPAMPVPPDGPRRANGGLGALVVASAIAQIVLTGGPVAAAILGARPDDVTGLFTALALFRAPYQLLGGFSGRLSVGITTAWLRSPRSTARLLAGSLAAVALLLAMVAWVFAQWLGLAVIGLVFGDIEVAQAMMTAAAVGTALALVAFVASIGMVAMGLTARLATVWVLSLAGSAVVLIDTSMSVTLRVAIAFMVAEAVALIGALWSLLKAGRSDLAD